jgi:hypothetical protein
VDVESRRWAVVGALLVGALLWPLTHGRDGFPLSTYPMFSSERGTEAKLAHVVARRADGSASPLPPRMLGTAEIMQAAQIARNAAKDRGRARDLCARVAERIAGDADWSDVVAIEVRTDSYDAVAYWSEAPGSRSSTTASRVHARCDVDRGSAP